MTTMDVHVCCMAGVFDSIAFPSSDGLSAVSSKPPATVDDLLRDTTLDDVEVFVVFRATEVGFGL